jgi:hypothetical protein
MKCCRGGENNFQKMKFFEIVLPKRNLGTVAT